MSDELLQLIGEKRVHNGLNDVSLEPVCEIMRNKAGQIFMAKQDGTHFDMSKYVGKTLYIIRDENECK